MSTTNSTEPGAASQNALIDSAFDATSVRTIDCRIATLAERIRGTRPRFAQLLPGYWAEIDHLLDLRLWLAAGLRD